jgi:hypothetical protein
MGSKERSSAVRVQISSAAEECKRAKSDSGAEAKIVHVGPESVFTMARNECSRCAGIGVHVHPENAMTTEQQLERMLEAIEELAAAIEDGEHLEMRERIRQVLYHRD